MKGGSFLYPALFKTLVIPPLLTWSILRFVSTNTPWAVQAALYLAAFPTLFILRSWRATLIGHARARRLGATDIPRVHGRLPLNLDVLLDWARSGSEEEVGWMMVLLGRRYGKTYNTRVLGEDQIISTDPQVFRHVLIDDFDNFVKGEKFYQRAEGFLGDGIFNSDGERWKFHRSLTRPFFHPTHISPSLFIPIIKRFMDDLPMSEPFDVQARIGQLALQMSILWLCGEDISAMQSDLGDAWARARDELGDALREAQKVVGRRVKIGTVWPLFELNHDPLQKPMKSIRTFFRPIIEQARQRQQSGQEGQHLIDRLVAATSDRKLVEDQLINLLLASRDTTSSLLTFMVYAVAIHPETAKRLRAEVNHVAGSQRPVDKDIIRDLRLCRAFINETLRLFPPVPLNIRRTLRSSLLPAADGAVPLYMPANTSVILATVLLHRDPAIWGPRAEEFDIDRWTEMGKEREAFTSWNIGPRMCLGQPLALVLAHTFLVMLLQRLAGIAETSTISVSPEANEFRSRMPETWRSDAGDGRARGGRDQVWIVADVVLAVKGGLWIEVRE